MPDNNGDSQAFNIAEDMGEPRQKIYWPPTVQLVSPMLFPKLEGTLPGSENTSTLIPEIFALGIISICLGSSQQPLHFSPDGNEVYWSPMIEIPDRHIPKGVSGYMKRVNTGWNRLNPLHSVSNFGR